MRRATVTVPSELEEALDRFVRDQEVPPALTAIMQAALREYLVERGYLNGQRRLHIKPAQHGSGYHDTCIEHDRYLTEP